MTGNQPYQANPTARSGLPADSGQAGSPWRSGEMPTVPRVLYESTTATVVHGDCRAYLPSLARESIDLVATDPPYGMDWRSNTRQVRFDAIEGDTVEAASALLADVTPELVRVLRRNRHAYTFGLPLSHHLFAVKTELVWDKDRPGKGDLSCAWGTSHERIYFHYRAADRANLHVGKLAARLRRGSVIRVRRLNAKQVKRHPTEKPVALMQHLIESSSLPGETVLDCFAGVGSTGVAAILAGRSALLIEADLAYAEIAVGRVRAAEALMAGAVGI